MINELSRRRPEMADIRIERRAGGSLSKDQLWCGPHPGPDFHFSDHPAPGSPCDQRLQFFWVLTDILCAFSA